MPNDMPEWAHRFLPVNEWAEIAGEHRATVYAKIKTGVYPPLTYIGGRGRLPGWEMWKRFGSRQPEAA